MAFNLLITLLLGIMPDAGSGFIFGSEGLYQPRMDFSSQIYMTRPPGVSLLEENPETQPKTGCLLTRWGVPAWAVETPAAFAAGHLLGFAIWLPIRASTWDAGGYDFVKLSLAGWFYVGVPVGAMLGTMGSGALVDPGGKWGATFKGAFIGDLCAVALTAGYYLIFGDPWAYGPGDEPPTTKTTDPFVKIFLPIVSIVPTAGAVIGYNQNQLHVQKNDEGMGLRPSWTELAKRDFCEKETSFVKNKATIEVNIFKINF